MTPPEELVRAVTDALHTIDPTVSEMFKNVVDDAAELAVAAVLRALPQPMKAEVTGNDDDRLRAEGWNDCLAAIAKLVDSAVKS